MACNIVLTETQRDWFLQRPVAWAIVNDGADDLSRHNSPHNNMVALLANMCDYARAHWQYEPGNTTHVTNTLRGLHFVTDCGSLAEMFQDIAHQLGYTDAKRWHIVPADERDRIVTGPNLACFTGQVGDEGIEGRWCFGDHWVVNCLSRSYDPTFNQYFDTEPLPPYFGWWGTYVYDKTVFATHYFESKGHPTIYTGAVPPIPGRAARPAITARRGFCGIGRRAAQDYQPQVLPVPGRMFYTFRRTDQQGHEVG